jgi:hypothetical protein
MLRIQFILEAGLSRIAFDIPKRVCEEGPVIISQRGFVCFYTRYVVTDKVVMAHEDECFLNRALRVFVTCSTSSSLRLG